MKLLKTASNKAAIKKTSKGTPTDLYTIEINLLNGTPLDMNLFRGKHTLFVNVASECGFTGQYKALETLFQKYKKQLMIVGVPCNQFGGQEPGNVDEIASFCERNFGVTFLIAEKVHVKGPKQHPLYRWLTQKQQNGKKSSAVRWNFQKYLVDSQGHLVDYYYSTTSPTSKKITKHLDNE